MSLVAEARGAIVEFAPCSPDSSLIEAMHVKPSRWHRGVGRELVETIEAAAIELGMEKIELTASLDAGQFYEKCGYTTNSNDYISM